MLRVAGRAVIPPLKMGAMQAHKSLVVVVGATGTRKSKVRVTINYVRTSFILTTVGS